MALRSFFLLTAVLATLLRLHEVDSGDPWNRDTMSVRIRNELPGFLAVHCKSRDDDLGQQHLSSSGKPYYFSFKNNSWGSMLFWCQFTYGPALWNLFEVWKGPGLFGKKKLPCEQCLWAVRSDAFYQAQEGTDPVIAVFPWHGGAIHMLLIRKRKTFLRCRTDRLHELQAPNDARRSPESNCIPDRDLFVI